MVFLGDSITEQWNGQRLGKKVDELDSIKNEFERLFNNKEEIRGLALGISGDTVSFGCQCYHRTEKNRIIDKCKHIFPNIYN